MSLVHFLSKLLFTAHREVASILEPSFRGFYTSTTSLPCEGLVIPAAEFREIVSMLA